MRIVLFYILIPLVVFILIFYLWGKSGNLSQDQLHQVVDGTEVSNYSQDTITVITYNLGYLSGMTNNLPVTPDEKCTNSRDSPKCASREHTCVDQ